MVEDEAYNDLPEDDEVAFLMLEKKFKARMEDRFKAYNGDDDSIPYDLYYPRLHE